MTRSAAKGTLRLSTYADRYIALLIVAGCGYMGFRILASAILPLSSLIGPTLLFVLAQGAGVVLVLKGVFRTGSEFEVHLKVIAMSVAIIGGVVFGSKLLDQAIRDKADAEKKTEVLLCQAKVSYAFTNPKEAERWCSVERNRTNLK